MERTIEQWRASELTSELSQQASEPGAKPTTSQPTKKYFNLNPTPNIRGFCTQSEWHTFPLQAVITNSMVCVTTAFILKTKHLYIAYLITL